MKKTTLAIILSGSIVASAAHAREPEMLRWVGLSPSEEMTVSIWDIDRKDFMKATVDGPENLRARLRDVQPQTLVTGRYGVEELATSGTRIPYPAWHGPYSAFDGMSLKVEPSSEMRGLSRLVVTEDRIERFKGMKAKDGSRAYAPHFRSSRYAIDFPKGGSRAGVYATPKGHDGYAYHLVVVEG